MIVPNRKLIFIHVYKVAGTSVKNVLRHHCEVLSKPKRKVNKLSRKLFARDVFFPYQQPLDGHAKAADYKALLGADAYDAHFKFAFVRNPFDWLVSLYEYMRQNPRHRHHELALSMSFAAFIDWRCGEARELQKDFVAEDGKVIVDFVGKFENLEEDFSSALARVGISMKMEHLNKSSRKPYAAYYDADTRRRVADAYAEDFELFAYPTSF